MRLLFSAALVALAVPLIAAEGFRTIEGRKLPATPVIDGTIGADEWAAAATSSGFVESSSEEATRYDTIVFLGYDDEAVYVAFRCFDPEPELIRATEYRREGNLRGDDTVRVEINPFGTFRRDDQNEFEVNPRGAASAEFAGGRAAKREWQGEWVGQSRITDTGWECEIRIPWKILRLPGPGERTLTINFSRTIPRDQLTVVWSSQGRERRPERTGRWVGVQLPLIEVPSEVQILPYQTLGYSEDSEDGYVFNSGVDMRHQFGTQRTGLATINPDFANVENAVIGIDFSRFERLADETRPFFTEGEDYFRVGGMQLRMFSPQRIDQIDFGAKLFGKITSDDTFGAMVTTRFDHETAAVLKYGRSWGPTTSLTVGGTYLRDEEDGTENVAAGIDFSKRYGLWGFSSNLGFTSDNDLDDGHRYDFDVNYSSDGLTVGFGWQELSEDFVPRLGFAPRRGFNGWSAFAFYRNSWVEGALTNIEANAFWEASERLDNGENYLQSFSASARGSLRSDVGFSLGYNRSVFLDGEVDSTVSIGGNFPANDPYKNVGFDFSGGEIEGERYAALRFNGRYRFPFRLTVSGSFQFVELTGDHNEQHIIGMSYELSEFQSLLGRAVIRNDDINWYLAFRQSGNLGIEYFVIVGDPNSRTFENRIVVKAVIPYSISLR